MADDQPQDATLENPDETPDPVALLDPAREWPHPWMGPCLAAMQNIPSISRAALTVQVDRSTVHRAMQRYEEFAVAMSMARDVALDNLEATLYLRATAGQAIVKTVRKLNGQGEVVEETTTEERHLSDTLGMFYLKRWRPEYRESFRVEQSGPNGGPIQIEHTEEGAAEFDTRLADLEARFAEATD